MTLTLAVAVIALVVMIVGEAWRIGAQGSVRDAPLSQATAVALAMATAWPRPEEDPAALAGVLGPLLLAVAAVLLANLFRPHWEVVGGDLLRQTTSVLLAGGLARLPGPDDHSLFATVDGVPAHSVLAAGLLLVVAVVAVLVPVLLRSLTQDRHQGHRRSTGLVDDLGRQAPLALATATTAVVAALALEVLGPLALVLSLLPLIVLQPAVNRQRQIGLSQSQTVSALARLTDVAGLTTRGHGVRVSRLAVSMAREAGVPENELRDLEAAALLHDIGQVGLSRPIPGGATVEVSGRDQRRIAAAGAAILARTAELSRLSSLVADMGIPHHRAEERGGVTLASRVLRVASAYDDLTWRIGSAAALERLEVNAPHEFDPVAVQALARHLERRRPVRR